MLVSVALFCWWKFETLPSQGVSKSCNLSLLDTRFHSKSLITFSLCVSKVEVIWPQVVSSPRGNLALDYLIAPPHLWIWSSQSSGLHSLQGIFPPLHNLAVIGCFNSFWISLFLNVSPPFLLHAQSGVCTLDHCLMLSMPSSPSNIFQYRSQ